MRIQAGKRTSIRARWTGWPRSTAGKHPGIVDSPGREDPHMSAFVVPITKDGRLSAKEFIGNRTKMSNDQSSYAEAVKHLGLVRGIRARRPTSASRPITTRWGSKSPCLPRSGGGSQAAKRARPGVAGQDRVEAMIETPLGSGLTPSLRRRSRLSPRKPLKAILSAGGG
ncbi:plasmid recombination protein [Klebsiella michiganensis]|uniref:plasmid recombination protein n=1 Tax=Klebsiella michiganensis TaxID=1134687 RepID=UPI003977C64E